ncbi:MAG TPA: KamA family radical SAM protein [Pseudomonadota bacterium]|nr:KamA family radical SAM protein [Pseudomonadota bacterium]
MQNKQKGSSSLPLSTDSAVPHSLRPPVDPASLIHRRLRRDRFWAHIPAYRDIDEATFADHKWQAKHTITNPDKLLATVQTLVSTEFFQDVAAGFEVAPMSLRVSPYLLSLIDWSNPYHDPLRIQFVPVASRLLPDHPKLGLDSLGERADAPTPGLTHRYVDKALFLALDTCPVYCRFCTRSYAVGTDTKQVEKYTLHVNEDRWRKAFAYVASRPEIEDIVISGGDAYNLRPSQIKEIGDALLGIDHIRRMRFATKGPAVMPQKLLTDHEWVDALTGVVERGRKLGKDVMVHTHFNHPTEITGITQDALGVLFQRGIFVRNQTVLIRGVNDTVETMGLLLKRLGYINVHPYYVYQHDMVKGVEDMRTTLQTALDIEKLLRGSTAGFNTPVFVMDAPGGGGKRDAHSFEYYNRQTGVSVYSAPAVKPGQLFFYFDPIDRLPPEGQARWADPKEHARMLEEAKETIRL